MRRAPARCFPSPASHERGPPSILHRTSALPRMFRSGPADSDLSQARPAPTRRPHRGWRHPPGAAAGKEIAWTKKAREARFGGGVDPFSYPYGDGKKSVRDLVVAAG